MIHRIIEDSMSKDMNFKKAIFLTGPRQVGKTTLVNLLLSQKETLYISGDNPQDRIQFSNPSLKEILQLIADFDYIFIDEAQRMENIGLTVKMIVDSKLKKQVIVSGSSAIGLANKIHEPLTGRKWEYELFPLCWRELVTHFKFATLRKQLDDLLIYGSYPEVVTETTQRERILKSLAGSYLYKDILELVDIKKPDLLLRLLHALALQIGSEVSYNELANTLRADRETIVRYIDLLEKSYVIFKLMPYHTNQRKEISAKPKIYFYDLGVRNTIIGAFQSLQSRQDIGGLWENFIIVEKLKLIRYLQEDKKLYYWRNTQQAEIDLVEVSPDGINAYEIKCNAKSKAKFSATFVNQYQPTNTLVIHRDNFWEFL